MYQTKAKWIITVCKADLEIAADDFLSYQNKTLIQASFLLFQNRSCLRILLRGLKQHFSKICSFDKRASTGMQQLNMTIPVDIRGEIGKNSNKVMKYI